MGALQPPVDHLVVEGELAHVRHEAQVAVPDVQHDEAEGLRVPVEEVLVPLPVVVVAHLQNVLLREAAVQAAHPAQREILQHLPGEGVPGAPDVQHHRGTAAKVHGLGGTEEGNGGQGRAGRRGGGQRGRQRLPRLRLCAHRWRLPLGDGAGSGRGGRQGGRDSGRDAAAGAPLATQERSGAMPLAGAGAAQRRRAGASAGPRRGGSGAAGMAGPGSSAPGAAPLRSAGAGWRAGERGAVRRRRGGDTPPSPPAHTERSGAPAARRPPGTPPGTGFGQRRGPPAPLSAPPSGSGSKLSAKRK